MADPTVTVDCALVGLAGEKATAAKRGVIFGTFNLGDDVAAGGEELTAALLNSGLDSAGYPQAVSAVRCVNVGRDESGTYFGTFLSSTGKVKAQQITDEAEATGDLDAYEFPFIAVVTTT